MSTRRWLSGKRAAGIGADAKAVRAVSGKGGNCVGKKDRTESEMGKFYAVKVGKTPGIYGSWDACSAMVHGYPGAVYKSFRTREEAVRFLGGEPAAAAAPAGSSHVPEESAVPAGGSRGSEKPAVPAREAKTAKQSAGEAALPEVYAFVDGSFNAATNVYGYGGFLVHHGKKEILQGSGSEEEMASMRNVAGEISGCMAAVQKAIALGLPAITVYYDYMGIEMWATGAWKRNKKGTIAYYDYISSVKDQIKIMFVKVKGHSGVDGNEEADALAKEAVKSSD